MYKKALIDAGLTQKQVDVYIACLEAGPSKVPEIARAAQIKRTTAYGVIDELVAMGTSRACVIAACVSVVICAPIGLPSTYQSIVPSPPAPSIRQDSSIWY